MKIKAEKCKFSVPRVAILGYIIKNEGAVTDDAKVQVVINWPQNIKKLQRFLGFARHLLETLAQTLH